MSSDFRHLLRIDTRPEHEALDQLFLKLDLAERTGFILFAKIHLASFSRMIGHMHVGQWAHDQLSAMISSLKADLGTLGATPLHPIPVPLGPYDDLAMDYIIGGSRMGTGVLRKRWLQSDDPQVRQANAYFGLPAQPLRWRETCSALSAVEPESSEARKITQDTRSIYFVFRQMYDLAVSQSVEKEPIQ